MDHNSVGYWVWFLIIGGVIGWLAGLIVQGRGFGIIGDIVVGVVCAFLGGLLAGLIGVKPSSTVGVYLVALAGAVILVGLTRLVVRHA